MVRGYKAVQETANSNAWNNTFKLQRRGPPRRRARKLLSLCHTRKACTKKSISDLPKNLDQWKKSELEVARRAKLQNILQEKKSQR